MEDAFESVAFAAAPAPERNELLTPPLTKRFGFANQKDPEQVRREAQEEARFKADMAPSRELHEEEKVAGDAVEHKLLMELLVQPVAEKLEPTQEQLTCRGCHSKYTDAHDSGGGCKKNQGFCSKTCRAAKEKGTCKHGRRKRACKDCGTGRYKHGRQRGNCKECGTGRRCKHGRQRGHCKECGTNK
jgi:hypothetical protein